MRILMTFNTAQIEATALIERSNLHRYVTALRRAGYLRVLAERRSGSPGSFTTYQLVRNTGPRAPILWSNKKKVFDQNTNGVFDQATGLPSDPVPGRAPAVRNIDDALRELTGIAADMRRLLKLLWEERANEARKGR